MPKTKVLIINGPPNSGKDDLANKMMEKYDFVVKREFKSKLYELVKSIYCVGDKKFSEIYESRKMKETPLELFDGLSVRQAMIKVSEEVIKPSYGNQYFGVAAANELVDGALNIFSDGGFEEEIVPLIEVVGKENFFVIRLERYRCNFDNDSRNYLKHYDYKIKNDLNKHELYRNGSDIVEEIFYKKEGWGHNAWLNL